MAATDATQLHNFLRSRRSVRRFTPEPVSPAGLERILATARHAPSAHNRQPWRFVLLQDPGTRARLAAAMGAEMLHDLQADGLPATEIDAQVERSYQRITQAPEAILLCADLTARDDYPDDERALADYTMLIQDVTLAGGALLYAAHAEGLSAVWLCAPLFAPATVRHELALPEHLEPLALVLLGWPAQNPRPKPLKGPDEVIIWR